MIFSWPRTSSTTLADLGRDPRRRYRLEGGFCGDTYRHHMKLHGLSFGYRIALRAVLRFRRHGSGWSWLLNRWLGSGIRYHPSGVSGLSAH